MDQPSNGGTARLLSFIRVLDHVVHLLELPDKVSALDNLVELLLFSRAE